MAGHLIKFILEWDGDVRRLFPEGCGLPEILR